MERKRSEMVHSSRGSGLAKGPLMNQIRIAFPLFQYCWETYALSITQRSNQYTYNFPHKYVQKKEVIVIEAHHLFRLSTLMTSTQFLTSSTKSLNLAFLILLFQRLQPQQRIVRPMGAEGQQVRPRSSQSWVWAFRVASGLAWEKVWFPSEYRVVLWIFSFNWEYSGKTLSLSATSPIAITSWGLLSV